MMEGLNKTEGLWLIGTFCVGLGTGIHYGSLGDFFIVWGSFWAIGAVVIAVVKCVD